MSESGFGYPVEALWYFLLPKLLSYVSDASHFNYGHQVIKIKSSKCINGMSPDMF
jgi:hypothetical protein